MRRILLATRETALDAFRAADNPIDAGFVAELERITARTRRELAALADHDSEHYAARTLRTIFSPGEQRCQRRRDDESVVVSARDGGWSRTASHRVVRKGFAASRRPSGAGLREARTPNTHP